MNGGWISITVVITILTTVTYFFPGTVSFLENAVGQAEETFGQNATFLEEIEDTRGQPASPAGKIDQNNVTLSKLTNMLSQQLEHQNRAEIPFSNDSRVPEARIIISGQNTYIIWETNKTGNWEIMFRASNDNGEIFGEKINLSNSSQTDSENAELAASGDKVYVVWHESTPASGISESVFRISNDSGRTFGPFLKLSSNDTIGKRETFLTYENSTYGIQLRYPSSWEAMVGENGGDDSVTDIVGFFSPTEHRLDSYEEKLWVSVDNLGSENITLQEYSDELIKYKNQTLRSFHLIDNDTGSNILAGYPAYRLVYTSNIGDGIVLKQLEIGTKIGDRVYYIDYYAEQEKYASFLPIIQEMINSFRIEENDRN